MFQVFFKRRPEKAHAAIFLSGKGTNAVNLLNKYVEDNSSLHWTPSVIVTDRPESSSAREIATRFSLPMVEVDIASFYRMHGMERVTIAGQGMDIRNRWTDELRTRIAPYKIDFGIMAGFVPLTNIVSDFPCLNVHPGDLTLEENGIRILAGLHRIPIETAILKRHTAMRSSVIVVQPFTPGAPEMDSGPIIGVSAPVQIELQGITYEELERVASERENKSRIEIAKDILAITAEHNLERLKIAGDWTVLPAAVEEFSAEKFALDDAGRLVWNENDRYITIKTVEYLPGGERRGIFYE